MSTFDRSVYEKGRIESPIARATGLARITVDTPDLETAAAFYTDFGLNVRRDGDTLYCTCANGADATPATAHASLVVERGSRAALRKVSLWVASQADLDALANVDLRAPGGIVVEALFDPARTQEAAALAESRPILAPRDASVPLRLAPGPSRVRRIGHAVLETASPVAMTTWLMRTFGMIISDFQTIAGATSDGPVIAFMRCDLGDTPADHHTLAIAVGAFDGLGHLAFEVDDLDEIGRGSAWLDAHGRTRAWGIGRHILGSQVFDYWRAPDDSMVEHYTDGDRLAASVPTGHLEFCGSNLAQWGPPVPRAFGMPPITLSVAARAARGVAKSEEVTVGFLSRAARALGR